ncbi:MAG: YraN family protein [bacterium]|nr:YraN family protein [bacterium]
MKVEKTLVGSAGERAAARFLQKKGYKILEQNYRVSGSEVDVIASKDDDLCFIEVKTRGSDDYGLPEEFVDDRKRRKIIRAAKIYSASEKYVDYYIRFDIISILYKQDDIIINHIEHAFEERG